MRQRIIVPLVLGALLASCKEGSEGPVAQLEILKEHPEASQVLFGLEHYVASEGIRKAKVVADTAFFLEDQSLVELRVMEVTFYDKQGNVSSVLTARSGTYDWDTGNMTASEDVVVRNPDTGERLETSVLYYERQTDRIWSDEPTKMFRSDGTIVEGSTFESTSAMDKVDLTSPHVLRPETERAPGVDSAGPQGEP